MPPTIKAPISMSPPRLKIIRINLPRVLDLLMAAGCSKIVLTGSVFENDEGAGSEPREAFSPYGLVKGSDLASIPLLYANRVK